MLRYWTWWEDTEHGDEVLDHGDALSVTERTITRRFGHSPKCLRCCSWLHTWPQRGTWIQDISSFGQLLVQESEGLTHENETQILSHSLFDTEEGAWKFKCQEFSTPEPSDPKSELLRKNNLSFAGSFCNPFQWEFRLTKMWAILIYKWNSHQFG